MERSPPRYGEGEGDAPRGTTRRLSAIMFTDMVGYTALMQEDESRARRDRDRQRVVLGRHIEHHGGRILQFYGDGALSVFDSAIEAVSSAVNIQRELAQEPRIALRVGIHTGDVAIIFSRRRTTGNWRTFSSCRTRLRAPSWTRCRTGWCRNMPPAR